MCVTLNVKEENNLYPSKFDREKRLQKNNGILLFIC